MSIWIKSKKMNFGLRGNSAIFRTMHSNPRNNSHLLTYLPALLNSEPSIRQAWVTCVVLILLVGQFWLVYTIL